MEAFILILLILNTLIIIFLIAMYNTIHNKLENIYYEISYVSKILDLILQYAENKYK